MICKVVDPTKTTTIIEFNYYKLDYASFYRMMFYDISKDYFILPEYKSYTLELYNEKRELIKVIPSAFFFVVKFYRGGRIFSFFISQKEWSSKKEADESMVIDWTKGKNMIVELELDGDIKFKASIVRIRTEVNQGLLITSFFIEDRGYIPAFNSDNKYTLRYKADDNITILEEFTSRARFRFSDTGPWYTTKVEVTEIQFLIEDNL